MFKKWSNYKHRFLPWIYVNFAKHATRKHASVDQEQLLCTVYDHLHNFNTVSNTQNRRYLLSTTGFYVAVKPSAVHNSGVFVSEGLASAGSVVGYYPGTVYNPGDSIFLQSLSNPYIFQCSDGKLIDGKNTGYSRMVYRSCCARNRLGQYHTCDDSWLSLTNLANPLSCGQLVNNGGDACANVAYCEVDIDLRRVKLSQRKMLPNVAFAEPSAHLRLVLLVATRDIEKGEELLSSYFTVC